MTLLVRKPAVLAVRNSKVTTSLRLQFKKWPRCYPRRPGICLKRLASASPKNLVAMARQKSPGLAQGGRRGCQDLYFRPGAAWPIFQRIMVIMVMESPQPSCHDQAQPAKAKCFGIQWFFQSKKHSTHQHTSAHHVALAL